MPITPRVDGRVQTVTASSFSRLDVERRLLNERIYDVLKQKILSQELKPSSVLPIRTIAQGLGVSVTPVRDALRRLSHDGLVQMRDRGETVVTTLRPEDVREIFDFRLALESHASRRGAAHVTDAAMATLDSLLAQMAQTIANDAFLDYDAFIQIDHQFHHTLVSLAKNQRLLAAYESLSVHIQIARAYYANRRYDRRSSSTHDEHRAIVDAYRKRDPASATQAVERHIENTLADILGFLGGG